MEDRPLPGPIHATNFEMKIVNIRVLSEHDGHGVGQCFFSSPQSPPVVRFEARLRVASPLGTAFRKSPPHHKQLHSARRDNGLSWNKVGIGVRFSRNSSRGLTPAHPVRCRHAPDKRRSSRCRVGAEVVSPQPDLLRASASVNVRVGRYRQGAICASLTFTLLSADGLRHRIGNPGLARMCIFDQEGRSSPARLIVINNGARLSPTKARDIDAASTGGVASRTLRASKPPFRDGLLASHSLELKAKDNWRHLRRDKSARRVDVA
jgi:hypothetical protein